MNRTPDSANVEGICMMLSQAFAIPLEWWGLWASRIGYENLRYRSENGEVVCALGFYPFAHYWLGKPVGSAGIAGVGTRPHQRGFGHVKSMLLELLRECKEQGFATSTLYPADWQIYRACGYELAGGYYCYSADLSVFGHARQAKSLRLTPCSAISDPELKRQYDLYAPHHNGWLKRNDALWARAATTSNEGNVVENFAYKIGHDDGYFMYSQTLKNDHGELTIQDYVLRNSFATQQLLSFLAYHSSMFTRVYWKGDTKGGFFQHNHSRHYKMEKQEAWMLRILDVPKSLMERGYSPMVSANLLFKINDPDFKENCGFYHFAVADGVAQSEPAKSLAKSIETDIKTFSALYSGYLSPFEARRQNRLVATDADCETLSTVFGGAQPWCPDYF